MYWAYGLALRKRSCEYIILILEVIGSFSIYLDLLWLVSLGTETHINAVLDSFLRNSLI